MESDFRQYTGKRRAKPGGRRECSGKVDHGVWWQAGKDGPTNLEDPGGRLPKTDYAGDVVPTTEAESTNLD